MIISFFKLSRMCVHVCSTLVKVCLVGSSAVGEDQLQKIWSCALIRTVFVGGMLGVCFERGKRPNQDSLQHLAYGSTYRVFSRSGFIGVCSSELGVFSVFCFRSFTRKGHPVEAKRASAGPKKIPLKPVVHC